MLNQLQRLLPSGKRVIILADRGFGKTDLARHCPQLGLDYVIRIKASVWICGQQDTGLLSQHGVRPGPCAVLRNVRFRKQDPVIQQVVVKGTTTDTFHLMTSLTAAALRMTRL